MRLTPSTGWRVDFNVALSSFETLIAGSRKLLDLALNSSLPGGPRVLFVSSISSVRSTCPPVLILPCARPLTHQQTTPRPRLLRRHSTSLPRWPSAAGTPRASGSPSSSSGAPPSRPACGRRPCVSGRCAATDTRAGGVHPNGSPRS